MTFFVDTRSGFYLAVIFKSLPSDGAGSGNEIVGGSRAVGIFRSF